MKWQSGIPVQMDFTKNGQRSPSLFLFRAAELMSPNRWQPLECDRDREQAQLTFSLSQKSCGIRLQCLTVTVILGHMCTSSLVDTRSHHSSRGFLQTPG